MIFQQKLQIIDSYVAQMVMTRAQHLEVQQAIVDLEQMYNEALATIETQQAKLDKLNKAPMHRD